MSRYERLAKLGEGGMGQVFEARDSSLGRSVAVKTILPSLSSDPSACERFNREARVTARLEHPNVPPVHDLGQSESGEPYLAMKLVRGQTLGQIIEALRSGDATTHARFGFNARAQLMLRLCEAVEYAHQQGVIHGDVKPDNVMVGSFGEVQLMDWGACLEAGDSAQGGFLGTPNYAAPERFVEGGAALEPSSDVWSLGIVMYELFTLKSAFPERKLEAVIEAVRKRRLTRPERVKSRVQRRCPKDFADVIRRATERESALRIATAAELGAGIALALQDEAPVVCLCTGYKRSVGILDRMVDRYGTLLVLLIAAWGLSPLLLIPLLYLRSK